MIKNCKLLQEFENRYIQQAKLTYNQSLKIYEYMYDLVNSLCKDKDLLDGLDKDIKISKVLNKCLKK